MKKTDVIPLTQELATKFYNGLPSKTLKGVAAVRDGEVIGIAGVYRHDNKLIMFSEIDESIRKDKRVIVKGIRALLKMINSTMPLYAIADKDVEGSSTLLEHMGFVKFSEGVYQWHS